MKIRLLWERPSFAVGLVIVGVYILMAIFADFIAPYKPLKIGSADDVLSPPSFEHIFGTDDLGRDIFSQIVYGSRVSIMVGFTAAFISIGLGLLVGMISGYIGKIVDEVLMRTTDTMMVIPTLPLMMVLTAILGKNIINVIIAIAVVGWPYSARVIRSQVLSLKESLYVQAAVAVGAGRMRVIFRHIFPSILSLAFAETVLYMATAIYSEAVLSFLGLGDPFIVSWGMILHNAFSSGAAAYAWWWIIAPGLAISTLILGFTLIGNTLYDIYNPRSKHI